MVAELTPAGTVNVWGAPVYAHVSTRLPPVIVAAGQGAVTRRVNDWVVSGETPFEAVIVMLYAPPDPVGVPASVPVPSPLSVNVTPEGKPLLALREVDEGVPLVVTVKLPCWPSVNVAWSALVIDAGP